MDVAELHNKTVTFPIQMYIMVSTVQYSTAYLQIDSTIFTSEWVVLPLLPQLSLFNLVEGRDCSHINTSK
jgi:hypothetical protein